MELLVGLAHDLRSPLTSILFLAETLHRGQSGSVNDVQYRQLGLIYSAAFNLSATANDIIELAREGNRLVEKEPVPFSVGGVLESVRDIVRPIAEEKQLELRLVLPAVDRRVGHSVALTRVLLNLTTNALKFTKQGQVTLVTRETSPTRIDFSVKDSGKGVDSRVLEALFGSAAGSNGASGVASFIGYGLRLCRKLIGAMGSELRVTSTPAEGSCFSFELELPPVSPPSHEREQSADRSA